MRTGSISACSPGVCWTRWHGCTAKHAAGHTGAAIFGASTGAAAALEAAAVLGDGISAVVSRGGRPDLASSNALRQVRAPTLLIVGAQDQQVLQLNRQAYAQLQCEKSLQIIPGATHLFEEAGTLEQVAHSASDWLERMFRRQPT